MKNAPPHAYPNSTLISVIIPVYRESAGIKAAVSHLKTIRSSDPLEIIIVDGHPQKDTIARIADRDVTCLAAPKGRGLQMNKGAEASSGDTLVFLHADTRLPKRGFQFIEAVMYGTGTLAGAFSLGIDAQGLPFRLIEAGAALRIRVTKIPYGDQAIFMDRRFFFDIGGFAPIPIMEDVELMHRIKKRGKSIVLLPQKVNTSARRWQKEGVITCTLRNWMLISLYYLGVSPHRLAQFYQ